MRRRRSRNLFLAAVGGAILGSLPLLVAILLRTLGGGGLLGLVWQGAYTFLVASTVYYRLSGLQL